MAKVQWLGVEIAEENGVKHPQDSPVPKPNSFDGGYCKGPELFWELFIFRFGIFGICCSVRFPCNFGAGSRHFNGIATFWSSNLSSSMVFATFGFWFYLGFI